MSRKLSVNSDTWEDPRFKKAFDKLPPEEQESIRKTIETLMGLLAECKHPALDPNLKPYSPTSYTVGKVKGLIEYRLKPWVLRIVVQCLEVRVDGEIMLVGRTLEHDHERIKALIKKNIK